MIELEKVALKNIVVHKDTTFEVEPGITCIRGQNGSGKSLLFSSIPNIVDGCPPLAKKKDAKVLHNESSGIAIKYRNDGVEYSLKQVSKNNSLCGNSSTTLKELALIALLYEATLSFDTVSNNRKPISKPTLFNKRFIIVPSPLPL